MSKPIEVRVGDYLGWVFIDAEGSLVLKVGGIVFTDKLVDKFLTEKPKIERI